MSRLGRVTWSEGMALDPHHFQQWDRYHLALLHARVRAIAPYAWGLTELHVDEEAVANGTLRLVRCSGTTADGLVFNVPDVDAAPPPRGIAGHFAPTADRLSVFLAAPKERVGGSNFLLPATGTQRETRYLVESASVVDETTGQDERRIDVAWPNLMLKFGDESLESYSTVEIAQLVRTPAGGLRTDDRFVPPAQVTAASRALRAITRRVLELLVTKSATVWERTRRLPRGQGALSAADVWTVCLQQAVNAFVPLLKHHDAGMSHPEALYATLAMLAGQLSALPGDVDLSPHTLPAYDHEHPTAAFTALGDAIARLLAGELAENYVTIPLARRDGVYVGDVDDGALLDDASFYLVCGGIAPGDEQALPAQLRVATPQAMPNILRGFLRALPVAWEPRPPTGAPAGSDVQYFRLQKAGTFWDEIRAGRSLAVFVPAHLTGLTVELIAVRQGA